MLRLSTKTTYTRRVSVDYPTDNGKTEKMSFGLEWRRLTNTETRELIELAQSGSVTDDDLIRQHTSGWADVQDGDGTDLPYSSANLARLMDDVTVRKAIMAAFVEDVFGQAAARKN